jgi:5-formyltetrahydrofolate cyclo-ligase
MKAWRADILPQDAAAAGAVIMQTLLSLNCVSAAACVMTYSAFAGEPDMAGFIAACISKGQCVALPCVGKKGEMTAVQYCPNEDMVCNRYGILEPMGSGASMAPDVIIVPGVAFSINGHRLGFGAGYYDRFLADTEAVKIGVCFDGQVVAHIDHDAHDIPMDIIVTEKRVIGEMR